MRRLLPVYRNEGDLSPAVVFNPNAELPPEFGGRGIDEAFDIYDADTGGLVERGLTPRQERDLRDRDES